MGKKYTERQLPKESLKVIILMRVKIYRNLYSDKVFFLYNKGGQSRETNFVS